MGAEVEDLLRLALQADGEGRPGTRDALLTLAVAESFADDPTLSERCRSLLTARQPDHWFATSSTHALALGQSRVIHGLARLRAIFPPVRVERLLLRGNALRGPFSRRPLPLPQVLDALSVPPPAAAPPEPLPHALRFPEPSIEPTRRAGGVDPDGALVALYWSLLVAMAVLLNTVLEPAARDSKAA